MATVSRINGTAVNIGYAGTSGGLTMTTITSTAIQTVLQSADYSKEATRGLVENEVGDRFVSFFTDPYDKASLKFIIKGTGLADAIAQTAVIEAIKPGDFLIVTACQQEPALVGTTWEVQTSPKITGTNKTAKEWSCELERAANITAVVAN